MMQNSKCTQIFVLCAGEGKRLRPYTETQPKCMVPYKGKALLQYQLDLFQQCDLKDITLIGGYRHEALPQDLNKIVNPDYAQTNMLYSLFCAADHMRDDCDWIISYGDIIYHKNVLEALLTANFPCNIVTDVDWERYWENRMEDPLQDAETFRWDPDTQRIYELGKKPKKRSDIQGQYVGLFKICAPFTKTFKALYQHFQTDYTAHKNAYMTDFLQYLIDQTQNVFGIPIHNHWREFDTVADLNLIAKEL